MLCQFNFEKKKQFLFFHLVYTSLYSRVLAYSNSNSVVNNNINFFEKSLSFTNIAIFSA